MVEINHREHFIRAKILYYGPAAGGKTTNLQALHRRALEDKRLDLVSVNTAQDRTILFDLLPLTTPAFRTYDLRFQIIAVPGQRLYAATRKMLLKNADTIVFVANSAADRREENLQSMKEMTKYLLEHGMDPSTLPIVFQYNKRDLPSTTAVEVMERGLNARRSESFPAVAIHEKGVLESFAAALRCTMTELSTRYNIGESLNDPRSAMEWTERTMRETFGVSGIAEKRRELKEFDVDTEPPAPARPATVVKVKTPSQPRTRLSSTPTVTPIETPGENFSPSPTPPAAPPFSKDVETSPSAAAELQDPKAAQSLVESYAEAASGLGDHLSRLREEKDEVLRWLEELSAVADMTRELLAAPSSSADVPLKKLLTRLAKSLHTSKASLSVSRPDGHLETVILHGLAIDPILGGPAKDVQAVGSTLLKAGKRTLQRRGESGPLDSAMDRAGQDCVAVLALPLGATSRPVGLLCFFLPQEAPFPNTTLLEYLDGSAFQLGTALDVAANSLASDRIERALKEAFVGRVTRHAVRWSEEPVARIESAVARIRAQNSETEGLAESLLQIENNILKLKNMHQSVMGLGVGLLPAKAPISVNELIGQLDSEFRASLSKVGIRLHVEAKSSLVPARAEPFLLWSVLAQLVEDARRSLAGVPSGGIIRVLAQGTEKGVRVAVFDNAAGLAPQSSPSRYLAWPMDARLREIEYGLTGPVLEHLEARLLVETRDKVGTVRTLLLPPA